MSNLWIIVFVLCWYPQTVSPTVHIVEQKTDWFTASQTCARQQGRLPGVNIYDHRLKLKDISDTKNIPSPFWVAATYDFINYNHCEPRYEDLCSDTFCQAIANSSGKLKVEWRPCWECNNFSCAFSHDEIYQEADWKYECKGWPSAFNVCTAMKLSLATRDNSPFLDMVTHSMKTFWLDDMPQSNLAPDIRMQNRTCLYSLNGIIHEGNCSDTSITTICILAHIVEQKTDWFTASKTCTRQQGRLPSVNMYDHRIKLRDLSETKNISIPFWIAATYDFMNYNHCELHYHVCPDTFCQTIAIYSGKKTVEWRPCWECNNFSCAISPSEIYQEVDWKWECKDWTGAFQKCKAMNLNLSSGENADFLNSVQHSAKRFWLDDMPQNSITPDIRMPNKTCLYSFNGIVHEGNCSDTSITTVCILAHIAEQKTDWFTASQTCTRQQGRLPSVNIYDHRLQLKDIHDTKNISSPFWIAVTFDFRNYNHCEPHSADLCSDTFCQTIAISSGKINVEWRPCLECNNFSCAYSPSEIYQEADWRWECKDWTGAFQYCKERNARLATRENALFLERVASSVKSFWLDDMPHSNLAPDIRMQNSSCLYSLNGIIHEGNCSDTSITTVCILV